VDVEHFDINPPDPDRLNAWLRCRDLWLASVLRRSGSARSADAYAREWKAFFAAHAWRLAPWSVAPTEVAAWAAGLAGRLAPATVNKSLAILTSYYDYAADTGRLWSGPNPFAGRHLRARVSRFGRARFPTSDQVRALLDAIDTSSPDGLRDQAIIQGMFATTRRVHEWLRLQWRDITGNAFWYQCKGGHLLRQRLPDGLRALIDAYLTAAGHYPPAPDDYVFVSLHPVRWDRPLNAGYVNQLLRRYGAAAGLPLDVCHAHGLRHAGARHRRRLGATTWELQQTLGHRSIATTEIYCAAVLDDPEDRLAGALDAFHPRECRIRAFVPTPQLEVTRK
jgi:integrase/recombinase XerD